MTISANVCLGQGGCVFDFDCLFVSLSAELTKSWPIYMKLGGRLYHGPRKNPLEQIRIKAETFICTHLFTLQDMACGSDRGILSSAILGFQCFLLISNHYLSEDFRVGPYQQIMFPCSLSLGFAVELKRHQHAPSLAIHSLHINRLHPHMGYYTEFVLMYC